MKRIALVHDWLTGMRGGEKVLEILCELYPEAHLYTLLHNKGSMSPRIEAMNIRTSFVQHLPFASTRYRHYLPLFPSAIESFDFSHYDVIISTSHCVAKSARPAPGAHHVCYCFTPMRYVWDMYDQYFGKGVASFPVRAAMRIVAPQLRRWDVRTSSRVHTFIADSHHVAKRIRRIYNRDSLVLHAPVDSSLFRLSQRSKDYYLVVSALVPYKRVDLAIDAFNKLGSRLLIVGSGPEEAKLKERAEKNIEFLGWQPDEALAKYYAGCRALIFPGEEDFGIVPLEAMASGKPVIAFAKGGALETVVEGGAHPTGVFFHTQNTGDLIDAVHRSEKSRFQPKKIRKHAEKFDNSVFTANLKSILEDSIDRHSHPQ